MPSYNNLPDEYEIKDVTSELNAKLSASGFMVSWADTLFLDSSSYLADYSKAIVLPNISALMKGISG